MTDSIEQPKARKPKSKKVKVRTNKTRTRRSPKALQKIKTLFLINLEHTANITEAFEMTPGIKYLTAIYRWKDTDKDFAEKYNAIRAMIAGTISDRCEDELITRATRGKVKKIYYQGKATAEEFEPSDDLLKFALKANSPKYSGLDQVDASFTINIQSFDAKGMPIEGETVPDTPKLDQKVVEKAEISIDPLGNE